MPTLKPWVHGPFELLAHAEGHLKAGSDFDKRMAIVSFDNAIEVSITTFLNLHPSQRGNRIYPRESVDRGQANYHAKLAFLEHFVQKERLEPEVTTDEIIWYHNLRNELYHAGNGMVPEERSLAGARSAAIWVFKVLFAADPEPMMQAHSRGMPTEVSVRRTQGPVPGKAALTSHARFLEQYIEWERFLRSLSPSGAAPVRVAELWSRWLEQLPDTTENTQVVRRASELRNRLVHGEPVDATDSELAELTQRLERLLADLQRRVGRQGKSASVASTDVVGWNAIEAAGRAVNGRPLNETEQIRAAIPIAAEAAERYDSRPVLRWDRGRYTGLPIAIYQNELYEHNRNWRFTDGTLCVLWAVEFPQAKSDYAAHPEYIRSTRTAYNNGRHQAPPPTEPSVAFDFDDSSLERP